MSASQPNLRHEPQVIAAGDTVCWLRQVCDFAPPTWTLKYVIRSGQNIYKFEATNDAGNFLVTLETSVTKDWKPGLYSIGAYVTDGTNQREVRTAFTTLRVGQNLAIQPTGSDPRSWASKTLEVIEPTIFALSARTVDTASVNGQMYTLANVSDLFKLRERLKSEVWREEEKARLDAGLGAGNKIAVRFRYLAPLGYPLYPRVPWQ